VNQTQVYNDELYHYGKLGMKWRHHKTKTLNDKYKRIISDPKEPVKLCENHLSLFGKFLGEIIPSLKKAQKNFKDYDLLDNENHKIGVITTNRDNKDTCNISWLGVDDKYRGSGYAQSAMRQIINDNKKQGVKYITLEVPTNSPDARHVYEKNGFVAGRQISDSSDVWGGLTQMKLKL
jgi:ribosomal protein S18 acetylase RimI-like enzyme